MKTEYFKIKMKDVREIVRKRGYYFIPAERLFDKRFVGPKLYIVTDDPDFTLKHPELVDMVIMTVCEFEPIVQAVNEYVGNEDRERHRIIKLLAVTNGKALILFTAKSDMTYVYGRLTNEKLPYKLLIQNDNSSQKRRLKNFRADTNSVILGSGTFWEGINIEGESLSQVIIYKLPFPVPDPINEYKMSLSKDPIMEVAVPEMIIKLKQGAGRLIRSSTDKGIVSILDPRVNSKSRATYRDITLNALLEKHITEDIAELQEFWNCINDKKEEVS